jgi:glucan phosphoethanolaminetransferase (alkaline phosphatase superfamily)
MENQNGFTPVVSVPKSTPRDVFMYLLVTGTLYATVVSLVSLLFGYTDVVLPDKLNVCEYCYTTQIRWSSSALVVVFPVFLFLFYKLRKEYLAMPEKREIRVRKWLIYLTILLTSVAMIVDMVTLVYNFYSGEITTRFLVKTLIVLVLTGLVFLYYAWDVKKKEIESGKTKLITGGVALLILGSLVGGFFVVGSPFKEREKRFDQKRITALQTIQGEVVNYWQKKQGLPNSLSDLDDNISGFKAPTDPETGAPFEYKVLGKFSFQLCAVFSAQGKEQKCYYIDPTFGRGENWDHPAGYFCFSRSIDPELYKPYFPAMPLD